MPTAVTLRSLVLNGGPVVISVIHDGLTLDSMDAIVGSLPPGDFTLDWFEVGDFDVRPTTASHLPDSTYFRLCLGEALPATVSRALYLDVDVLVRRSLTPLLDIDLEDSVLAAVQSVNYPWVATRGAVNDWRRLGLDPRAAFFNAGVLLVDVDRWRAEGIATAALDYLRSPHCGRGADQEALNVVCSDRWRRLEPTWNQQTPMLDDHHGAHLLFDADTIDAARRDPHIVHFQTRPKPWHVGSGHPWRAAWLDVAAGTRYGAVTDLRQRSLADEWRWRARRAASALVKGR